MSNELTVEEEGAVSGSPDFPAYCGHCGSYSKVFNQCTKCGNDERTRHGCEHRIGLGGVCDQCRTKPPRELLVQHGDQIPSLLERFSELKLTNNRAPLLALQVEAVGVLQQVRAFKQSQAKEQ